MRQCGTGFLYIRLQHDYRQSAAPLTRRPHAPGVRKQFAVRRLPALPFRPPMNVPARDSQCRCSLDERTAAAMSSQPVPSPCVNLCRIEPVSGLCAGCRRTLDEIAAWSRLDDDARRAVWALLPGRAQEQQP